jgi:hypothetical protein
VIDARVPCPLCGGLVHPVAGRCKHCKGDLTTFRAGRPQAAIPLPSLLSNGHANAQKSDRGLRSNGHAAVAAVPAVALREESVPILPPRESAHGMPAARVRSSALRWPVVVIVLATVAIVGAVVVMFWLPPSRGGADSHSLKPPPAPERMDLNPIPPPNADPQPADPWGAPPGGHSQVAPPTRRQLPAVPAMPVDPSDPDPFASNGGGPDPFAGAPLGAGGNLDFVATLGRHLCDRLTQCGNSSEEVTSYCNLMKAMPAAGGRGAPTCASAKRCLDHIDTMACSAQADDAQALQLMTQLPDCVDAITRC